MPTKYPYTRVISRGAPTYSHYYYRNGFKTKPVRSIDTTYIGHIGYLTSSKVFTNFKGLTATSAWSQVQSIRDGSGFGQNTYRAAYNKAHSKFREQMSSARSSMGAFAAESGEALDMITARAVTLRSAYKEFRKGNFRKGLRTLKCPPLPKHQGKRWNSEREASALWLEYWFGWSPAINDIYSACEVLTADDFKPTKLYGVGADGVSFTFRDRNPPTGPNPSILTLESSVFRNHVKVGGRVSLSNKNAALLNQLGLVNPLGVLWEVIPFSFLVDWVSNVGDVLNSYTFDVGYTIDECFISTYVTGTTSYYNLNTGTVYADWVANWHSSGRWLYSSLPFPKIHFDLPDRLSLTRAASSIALLVSVFLKG